MSFVPRVEDDPHRRGHFSDAADVLSTARLLALHETRTAEAYELLSAHRALATVPSVRREWREAAVALLAQLHDRDAAAWLSWAGDEEHSLPLPKSSARNTLSSMEGPSFLHTALLWVKLAALQRRGDKIAAAHVTQDEAAEILLLLICELCCGRLTARPRSIVMWRLLAQMLSELKPHEECLRRLEVHVRHCILSYLETCDRTLVGCGGLNQCHGGFDVVEGDMNENITEEISARELVDAMWRLCGREESAPVRGEKGEALEGFVDRFFLRSAPEAFDRHK